MFGGGLTLLGAQRILINSSHPRGSDEPLGLRPRRVGIPSCDGAALPARLFCILSFWEN